MKNNTKVRLHLSKQLFESLTKQVLAEAKGKKNFGAGMEEVKAPKDKKEKAEEPKKKEHKVAEVSAQPGIPKAPGLNISKNATPNIVYSKQDLKVKLMDLARQLNMMKGLDNAETSALGKLIDDITSKLKDGSIANSIKIADKAFSSATRNVKPSAKKGGLEEMETEVAEGDKIDEYVGMHPDTAQLLGTIGNIIAATGGVAAAITLAKQFFGSGSKEAKEIEALAKKAEKATGETEPKA